jgi:hypothetical protein
MVVATVELVVGGIVVGSAEVPVRLVVVSVIVWSAESDGASVSSSAPHPASNNSRAAAALIAHRGKVIRQ